MELRISGNPENSVNFMVPTWTGKSGKMRKLFPVRKKYWKSQGNLSD